MLTNCQCSEAKVAPDITDTNFVCNNLEYNTGQAVRRKHKRTRQKQLYKF